MARNNLSGTITLGATAQTIQAAGNIRNGFAFQNVSDADMWVGINVGAAVADSPCILIPAGALYETAPGERVEGLISVICATTGKKFTAWSW